MAVAESAESVQIHRLPQSKYVDGVRWFPSIPVFDRFAALALFDSDSSISSVEIHALNLSKSRNHNVQSSWVSPSRISSLRVSRTSQKSLVAVSTLAGSLHVLLADPIDASVNSVLSIPEKKLHDGPISCIDLQGNGAECVSVGEDGIVNCVTIEDSKLTCRRIFDGNGLVSYNAVKWASPTEFATGGLGFNLQWWDIRSHTGPVSQFNGNRDQNTASGIVHSIDVHPSRKHMCLAGGSLGTVFAWDLRGKQQPVILSGIGMPEGPTCSPIESQVWEVQFDPYCGTANLSLSKMLPAMMCSEDGILAFIEQGKEPTVLFAEPCAINGFDIDEQNPSDIICRLEWESVAVLRRP